MCGTCCVDHQVRGTLASLCMWLLLSLLPSPCSRRLCFSLAFVFCSGSLRTHQEATTAEREQWPRHQQPQRQRSHSRSSRTQQACSLLPCLMGSSLAASGNSLREAEPSGTSEQRPISRADACADSRSLAHCIRHQRALIHSRAHTHLCLLLCPLPQQPSFPAFFSLPSAPSFFCTRLEATSLRTLTSKTKQTKH